MLSMTQPWRPTSLTFLLLLTFLFASQAITQKNENMDLVRNHNLIIKQDVSISQRENARRDKQTNEAENSPNDEHQKVTDSIRNDEFQVIPLTTTNGNHEATIYVGTPPQALLVSIDTVSPFTFLPCSNTIKMSDNGSFLAYDRQASISYNPSVCRPKEPKCDNFNKFPGTCVNDVQCAFTADTKPATQYEIGTDVVYAGKFFGQGKDDSFASQYSFRYSFGCHVDSKDTTQGGVLGMGNSDGSFSQKMAEEGIIGHNMYALCFSQSSETHIENGIVSGMMTLGGIDPRVNNSPMRYALETRRSRKNDLSESFVVNPRNYFLFVDEYTRQISSYGNKVSANESKNFVAGDAKMFKHEIGEEGLIWDSLYPYTMFPKFMKKTMGTQFFKMTGQKLDNNKPIKGLTWKDIDLLPTILIQLRAFESTQDESTDPLQEPGFVGTLDPDFPNDVLLAIKPRAYMEHNGALKTFTPRIYFSSGSTGRLGKNAMIDHNILYDIEHGRVGIAESFCSYQDLAGDKEENLQIDQVAAVIKDGVDETIDELEIDQKEMINEEEASMGEGMQVSADCVLGPENEVIACEDTIDNKICATSSSDFKLYGTLMVDRIIESPPLLNGKSCLDVLQSGSKKNIKTIVDAVCNDAGVCTETRQCSRICEQFAPDKDDDGEHYVGNEQNPSFKPESCGEPFFGSCQYTCEQTQIISLTNSDGECKEVNKETRPCHTSECGRENACLVPFVVHIIFIFFGANADKWNRGSEELFREAMSNAISQHPISYQKKIDITPGDIDVLLVTPYHSMVQPDDDGSDNEVESSSAMKVVAEISIYNSDLARTDKIEAFEEQAGVGDAGGGKHVLVNIKCEEDDIVAYAHDALAFNNMFEDKDFMALMYGSIQNVKGMSNAMYADSSAPFDVDISASRESMILSSWTIRSEVGLGAEAQDAKSNVSELLYPLTFIIFLFAVTGCIFRYYGTEVQRDFITMNMAAMAFKRQAGASDVEKGNYTSLGLADDKLSDDNTFEMASNNSYEIGEYDEVDNEDTKDSSVATLNHVDNNVSDNTVFKSVNGEDKKIGGDEDFEPSDREII